MDFILKKINKNQRITEMFKRKLKLNLLDRHFAFWFGSPGKNKNSFKKRPGSKMKLNEV